MPDEIDRTGDQINREAMKRMEISGSLIARNAVLNLIGQAVPLVVGVLTIPFVVRGLGTDRFGLLSLAWVVLGYFTIFDLGLGRATTKYVAEALGRGEEDSIHRIVWTAVTFQSALGLIGTIVFFVITDFLVERVLNIPPELLGEAKDTFHLLAFSIPLILVSSSLSGVLEAAQKFDLLNAVRIPSSILTFVLPLIGLAIGMGLPGIVVLILLARFGSLIAFIVMCRSTVPKLRTYSFSSALFSDLFCFGGWITISNLIIPIFVYIDRFLIGALLTMSAVAYYTVPYDAINRLLIIPGALASVLFPTFSSLASSNDKARINFIVMRSTKYLLMTMTPITIVLLIFGEDILRLWIGTDFAQESITVFRLLSISVLLNAIGYTPFALIQGIGRPDVVAKYHLAEFPIYLGVAFLLISHLGINGAALAWLLRMAWAIPIFYLLCAKVARIPLRMFYETGTSCSFIVAAVVLTLSIILTLLDELGLVATGFMTCMLIVGCMLIEWFIVLDYADKTLMKNLIMKILRIQAEERW